MPATAAAAAAVANPTAKPGSAKRTNSGRSTSISTSSSASSTAKPKQPAAVAAQLNPFDDSDDEDGAAESDRGDRSAGKRPRQESAESGTGSRRGVVLKRQPITGSVPITLPNGRRMFLGMQKKADAPVRQARSHAGAHRTCRGWPLLAAERPKIIH